MTSTCKFTAAACGADGADRPTQTGAPRGERCSIMREDCHQTSAQNRKKTPLQPGSLYKKENKLYPFCPSSIFLVLLFIPLRPFFSSSSTN